MQTWSESPRSDVPERWDRSPGYLPKASEVSGDVVDPLEVLGARPSHHAVNLVPVFQQPVGEIRTVLPSNAGNECSFHVHKSNSRNRPWHALVKSTRVQQSREESCMIVGHVPRPQRTG